MFYYLPLEGYAARYTHQWSAPETGWLERNWLQYGLKYKRVDSHVNEQHRNVSGEKNTIKVGAVLDARIRAGHCFHQVMQIVRMAYEGEIKDSDTIYFDDFWHPGIEALPYTFHQLGIRPRVYCFLHAQSVDEYDFTYPMRNWMRHFEKGIGEFVDGIFVCCPFLKDLVRQGGIAYGDKIHVTGHPFNSEEVLSRMPRPYQAWMQGQGNIAPPFATMRSASGRDNVVVWSSRWDAEKDPHFFMEVVRRVVESRPDIVFKVCTSAPRLRSNDTRLLQEAFAMQERYPKNFLIREGLTKEQYYTILTESKVQFNCALQDFVPITLQEAMVAGCVPIYPYFRSFPELFESKPDHSTGFFTYPHRNEWAAAEMIKWFIAENDIPDNNHWSRVAVAQRAWLYQKWDLSWIRMLDKMNLLEGASIPEGMVKESRRDPFARA
jgi:glycosyltransferase involved in cell wall biosynthesis